MPDEIIEVVRHTPAPDWVGRLIAYLVIFTLGLEAAGLVWLYWMVRWL